MRIEVHPVILQNPWCTVGNAATYSRDQSIDEWEIPPLHIDACVMLHSQCVTERRMKIKVRVSVTASCRAAMARHTSCEAVRLTVARNKDFG